jgi:hypothetical protein
MTFGEETALLLAAERKAVQERAHEYILGPKPQRGRPKIPPETAKFYRIGLVVENSIPLFEALIRKRKTFPEKTRRNPRLVRKLLSTDFSERQVDAGLAAKTPTIAARHLIADAEDLSFVLVAEYHRKYRAKLKNLAQ